MCIRCIPICTCSARVIFEGIFVARNVQGVRVYAEFLASTFPSCAIIPLWQMLFLGWCMAPISSNGSQFIYHRFIKPFVLKHQKQMDEALEKVGEVASSTLSEGTNAVICHLFSLCFVCMYFVTGRGVAKGGNAGGYEVPVLNESYAESYVACTS